MSEHWTSPASEKRNYPLASQIRRSCCDSTLEANHADTCALETSYRQTLDAEKAIVLKGMTATEVLEATLERKERQEHGDPDLIEVPTPEPTVLEEANELIYGDRQSQYGSARQNFGDIAALWTTILGIDIEPEQVVLCLIGLKMARAMRDVEKGRYVKRDTAVDIAGYAGCLEKLEKGL